MGYSINMYALVNICMPLFTHVFMLTAVKSSLSDVYMQASMYMYV